MNACKEMASFWSMIVTCPRAIFNAIILLFYFVRYGYLAIKHGLAPNIISADFQFAAFMLSAVPERIGLRIRTDTCPMKITVRNLLRYLFTTTVDRARRVVDTIPLRKVVPFSDST